MATTLLHDMIHNKIEVYVDDMMVKSSTREGHFEALDKFLARAEKYNLRLNMKKCMFGVTSRKLLGHIISQKGIELDPDKIRAIKKMTAPKTEKEVRGFVGHLQYISRFIAKLMTVCELIFKLLRKNQPVIWDEKYQQAFEAIKSYLTNPPVLQPPRPGKTLTLYLAIEKEVVGAMLTQEGDDRIEHVVYYLSKKLLPYEAKYELVEKMCLVIIWAMKKIWHYF